ncbi:MAG: 3-isopropylmalate dehydrogenase [Gammaproteobacteria bacterium]|nr:3-isopropylmalate dehydrogenase [Gammaproteobacteria bacterium]
MKAKITLLPGDGIGPEVTDSAKYILDSVALIFGHDFIYDSKAIGGIAIDQQGSPLPDETILSCKNADAIFLGAVGGPKWSNPNSKVRPEQGLLGIRSALNLYANIRPVKIYPELVGASPLRSEILEGVDIIIVRELTGGIYFGKKSRNKFSASDLCVYTTEEIERIIKVAANLASNRKGKLCSVDKANVLETSRLWRDTTNKILKNEYPEIEVETLLVDAAAMHLLSRPSEFDVMVTENMFGDILTDEASMLTGSLGMLPSASLGESKIGIYEPIHGSAPDIAGQEIANPCASIASVALLLRHSLGLEKEAKAVENAISTAITSGARTVDISLKNQSGISTLEMTTEIAKNIN